MLKRLVLASSLVMLVGASLAEARVPLAQRFKNLPAVQSGTKFWQKTVALGAIIATCGLVAGCENRHPTRDDNEPRYIYVQPPVHENRTVTASNVPDDHWQTQPQAQPHAHRSQQHDDGQAHRQHVQIHAHHDPVGQQIIGGEVRQQAFTTYVHVSSGYRNTERRRVYAGDDVYFLQNGGIYMGRVEREMPPNRALIGDLYGTRIYGDAGEQKRIVSNNDIMGFSLGYHQDVGLELVLENDHEIFRREDDDYMERFYARVEDVYSDGYYRMRVTYGTAPGGHRVNLRDPYVIFMHKNIWPIEGHPIDGHEDVGSVVMILGEEDSHIEYLLGEVMQVMDDGFYDIEIYAKRDFDGNHIDLRHDYRIFVHESTPARDGGMLFAARRD